MLKHGWSVIFVLAAGILLAPQIGAQNISAEGTVESKSGGFVFPDGSVQTTSMQACETLAPDDEMVRVGPVCIDKYEASVWDAPVGGTQLITEEQIDEACSNDGQDCHGKIFARSVFDVEPARRITWFQAQQALANAGKRLPTNAEWQMAVSGTPDHPGPCNTESGSVRNTGADSDCVSHWGAFDMVGNLWEWVADWVPASTACPGWADDFGFSSDDDMCLAGASTSSGPGALVRGGNHNGEEFAGPFAVEGERPPSNSSITLGFRGAR